jgi:hypothetical protein
MKGTNGRNNSGPDGDRFRDFITHREPLDLQRKAILAWREYEEMELSRAHGPCDDGQATANPMNGRSGSQPLADVIKGQIAHERIVFAKEEL